MDYKDIFAYFFVILAMFAVIYFLPRSLLIPVFIIFLFAGIGVSVFNKSKKKSDD